LCENCNGILYYECTSCPNGRVLKGIPESNIEGRCECENLKAETLEVECLENSLSESVQFVGMLGLLGSTVVSILIMILNRKYVPFGLLVHTAQ